MRPIQRRFHTKKIAEISLSLGKKAVFFGFPFLVVLFTEYASSGSIASVLGLISGNTPSFLFSYFLVLLLFSLLFVWLGEASFFLSFLLFVLLATVSFYKNRILNDYLFPTDISVFGGSSGQLANFLHIDIGPGLIGMVLLGIIVSVLYFHHFKDFRWERRRRILAFLGLSLLSAYIFSSENFRLYTLKSAIGYNIEDVAWRQKFNYEHNGFITAFFINLGNIYVKKPDNYSDEKIAAILKDTKKQNTASGQMVKPNVIFILSEAFWDITKIPGISFGKDPLANFRKLKKGSTGGNLISPTYGWKTQWVEFEALTGNMMKFLPFGSMPYDQYIKNPLPSVVWEFKKNGYETLALHTYEKTFFNRHKAYPFLGFDTFIGVEDLRNPKYKWPFVSDDEFADRIIDQLKHKGPDPLFLFGISMQNHFTYEGEKYPEYDINLKSDSKLSDKSMQILKNYAQGLSDADKSLGKLIDYVDSQKEPTVVVFFWDHLGSLGENYFAYRETGYIKSQNEADWSPEELLKMYSTEFVVWDNFWLKKEEPTTIGASYLGNHVLDMLGFQSKNPYFDFISHEFERCIIADSQKVFIDREWNTNIPDAMREDCKDSENNHRLLQYDIMFGKRFSQRE